MRLTLVASLSMLTSMATAKNAALRAGAKTSNQGDHQTTQAFRKLASVVFYTKECLDAKPATTKYFGVAIDVEFTGAHTCTVDDQHAMGVHLEGLMADFSVEAKLVEQHAFAVIMCPKQGQIINDDFFSDLTPKLLPPPGAREPDPTKEGNAIVPGIEIPVPPSYVVVGDGAHGIHQLGSHGEIILNNKTTAEVLEGTNRKLQQARWVWSWRGGGASKRCVAINDTAIPTPDADALASLRLLLADRIDQFLAVSKAACLAGVAAEVFVTLTPVNSITDTHLGCATN